MFVFKNIFLLGVGEGGNRVLTDVAVVGHKYKMEFWWNSGGITIEDDQGVACL